MTPLLLALLLLLGNGASSSGDANSRDLARAESAYRAGQYEEALTLFESALSEPDVPQGPVLYNLGNCAYRLGRHAEAMVYYRRALLRMPRDRQAKFNLTLVERRLDVESEDGRSIGAAITAWVGWFTPAELLVLAAILQGTGLVLLLLGRRGATPLVLVGLMGAVGLLQSQWFPSPPAAVVIASEIGLRSEPHAALAVNVRLHAGQVVRVAEMSDRWVRVVHPQGGGWTERAGVGLVN